MIQTSLGLKVGCALTICRADARNIATFAIFRHVVIDGQGSRAAFGKNLLFFLEGFG